MSTECRLVDREAQVAAKQPPQPGDMWFCEYMRDTEDIEFYKAHIFSPEYIRDWLDKRSPIMVCLPDGHWWCIDQRESGGVTGWVITGEAPNVTAHPSIQSEKYHGWLQNGVLTDDIEGRTYGSAQ